MKKTLRPSRSPTPVTIPSAGRSSLRLFAKSPSSNLGLAPKYNRRRSRTKSLPSLARPWRYFSGPPFSILAMSSKIRSSRLAAASCCFIPSRWGTAVLRLAPLHPGQDPAHVDDVSRLGDDLGDRAFARRREFVLHLHR